MSAQSACAAIRARVSNPIETRFIDSNGSWITAHQTPMREALTGRSRLVEMAVLAIQNCLETLDQFDWRTCPVLLCLSESDRPGREVELDKELFKHLQLVLGVRFAQSSMVIARGRVGVLIAIDLASQLLQKGCSAVLVVATDSLLTARTLSTYIAQQRLLTEDNSNGFIPGEGAGALLLGKDSEVAVACIGLGFSQEDATILSENPLKGVGLATAIKIALKSAGLALHEMDFRSTDIAGEQYYFKEAAIALSRLLRGRKEKFDLWHHAECVGEIGAASAIVAIVSAAFGMIKGYAPGLRCLIHISDDSGARAAAVITGHQNRE
jgi:3-oxoacyl-[acyl-carrier-protein] synthase-1